MLFVPTFVESGEEKRQFTKRNNRGNQKIYMLVMFFWRRINLGLFWHESSRHPNGEWGLKRMCKHATVYVCYSFAQH